jgi:hypothetical protein
MTTQHFEAELRDALAGHAARVPEDAAARLRQLDFRPRHRSLAVTSGVAAGVLATAAAIGLAVAGLSASGVADTSAAGTEHAITAAGHTIRLAGYTFTINGQAHVSTTARGTSCAPKPPVPGTAHAFVRTRTGSFSVVKGGVSRVVNGGCLNIDVKPAITPAGARAVAVGPYSGFVTSDPAASRVTLYVEISASNDLVFTATRTQLSAAQLITMASNGLSR